MEQGVYPVFTNVFKIGSKGLASTEQEMIPVKEMETFEVSIDGNKEEWSPMEEQGWLKRAMTGKALGIKLSGKRSAGDPGNDYVASIAWKTGRDCETKFEWAFPNGDKLTFNCLLDVSTPGGGDSRNLEKLEFEALSIGKPTYTPAVVVP